MKTRCLRIVCCLGILFAMGNQKAHAQFWSGSSSSYGLEEAVAVNLSGGLTFWDYLDRNQRRSFELGVDIYDKGKLGFGILGENDFYLSATLCFLKSDYVNVQGGLRRYTYSENKGFSHVGTGEVTVFVASPLFVKLQGGYAYNSKLVKINNPAFGSAEIGLRYVFGQNFGSGYNGF